MRGFNRRYSYHGWKQYDARYLANLINQRIYTGSKIRAISILPGLGQRFNIILIWEKQR